MTTHRKAVFVLLVWLQATLALPMDDKERIASFLASRLPQSLQDKAAAIDSLLKLMAEVDLHTLCQAVYPPAFSPTPPRRSPLLQPDPHTLSLAPLPDYVPFDLSDYADLDLGMQDGLPLPEAPVTYGLPGDSAISLDNNASQASSTATTIVHVDPTMLASTDGAIPTVAQALTSPQDRVDALPVSFSALANPSEAPENMADSYEVKRDMDVTGSMVAVMGTKNPALREAAMQKATEEAAVNASNPSAALSPVEGFTANSTSFATTEKSVEEIPMNPLDFASKILSDLSKLRFHASDTSAKKNLATPTDASSSQAPIPTKPGKDNAEGGPMEVIGVEMTQDGVEVVVKRTEDQKEAEQEGAEDDVRRFTRNLLLNSTRALVSLASTVDRNETKSNAEAPYDAKFNDVVELEKAENGTNSNTTVTASAFTTETNSSSTGNATNADNLIKAAATQNATDKFGLNLKQNEINFIFEKAMASSSKKEDKKSEPTPTTERKLVSLMFTTSKGFPKENNTTADNATIAANSTMANFTKTNWNETDDATARHLIVHPTGKWKGFSAAASEDVEGSGEAPSEPATNYIAIGNEGTSQKPDSHLSITDELAMESLTLVNTATPPTKKTSTPTKAKDGESATTSPVITSSTTTSATATTTTTAVPTSQTSSTTVEKTSTPAKSSFPSTSSEASSTPASVPTATTTTATSTPSTLFSALEDVVPSLPGQTEQERLESLNYALGEFNMLDSMNAINNFNVPSPPLYKAQGPQLTDAERGIIEHPESHYGHDHVASQTFGISGGSVGPTSYPESEPTAMMHDRDPYLRPHSAATHGEYGDTRGQVANFWENYLSPDASYWGSSQEQQYAPQNPQYSLEERRYIPHQEQQYGTAQEPTPGYYGPYRRGKGATKQFNFPFLRALTGVNQETVWSAKPQRDFVMQNYQCPGLFGYYPDLSDCRRFQICSWGVSYRFKCPPGTAWNQFRHVCDWDVNVNCVSS